MTRADLLPTIGAAQSFEQIEGRACAATLAWKLAPWDYPAFVDSVVPILVPSRATNGARSAPILISPPPDAVLDQYPRRTPVVWHRVDGADHYLLEVQLSIEFDGKEGRPTGWHWIPHGDQLISARVKDTSAVFYFVGASPGRWRVRAIGRTGEWHVSEWRAFTYTR